MKPDLDLVVPPAEDLGAVHFVGIGGAGMSGIARIMLARGMQVSGTDAKDSRGLAALRALGARVEVGHAAEHLGDARTLVVSSAVRDTNPELVAARERGLLVLHRSQALTALMAGRRGVAVAGTAGKTTTTSMVAVALQACGADPSFAIGGELADTGANAHNGSGDVFVAEADESDGTFLLYGPLVAVVTNVEPDHLDFYGIPENVEKAFADFCGTVRPGGTVVACVDDPGARRMLATVAQAAAERGVSLVGYGRSEDAAVRVRDLRPAGTGLAFTVVDSRGVTTGADGEADGGTDGGAPVTLPMTLRVPGDHNALNAAAAYAAVTALGFDGDRAAAGLAAFSGTRRRFEAKGEADGVRVVDDYAHHPTKVAAALSAARSVVGGGRVVAVFQPHLFSRTRIFAAEFGQALGIADEVVVMDVYAAREDPEPGVTGALVADAVPLGSEHVAFVPSWSDAAREVVARTRPGDLVLTIGAGDVTMLGPEILALLAERAESADAGASG